MFYVTFTYTQSGRIMAAEPPIIDDDDYALEEIIVRERKSIGFPWDTNDIQSDSESVDTVVRKNADGIKNPAGTHAFGHSASQTSPA